VHPRGLRPIRIAKYGLGHEYDATRDICVESLLEVREQGGVLLMTDKRDDHGRRDDAPDKTVDADDLDPSPDTEPDLRPARSDGRRTHECPRVAVRLRHNLSTLVWSYAATMHTCSRPRTPVASDQGAQRPVAPRSEPNAGSSCLRSAHRTRSGRASVIVMLRRDGRLAGAGFRSRLGVDAGGDSSWFMEQLVGRQRASGATRSSCCCCSRSFV